MKKNIEGLFRSKGGLDAITYHEGDHYVAMKLPVGTIDRYFGAKRWAALIE